MKTWKKRILTFLVILAVFAEPWFLAKAAAAPAPSVTKKTLYVDGNNYKIQIKNLAEGSTQSFSSSDSKIAKVSKDGVIKPVAVGTATITVKVKQAGTSYTSKIAVTVSAPYVKITSAPETLTVGDTYAMKGKSVGFKKPVLQWKVSNTKLAKIDANTGVLTALAEGSVKVALKETNTGKSRSCTVQIVAAPKEEIEELEEDEVFEYDVTGDEAIVTGVHNMEETALAIPSKLGGYKVTGIDDRAFEGMQELTSVRIPSTVTRIGDSAFGSCENLRSITLPKGLVELGSYAFEDCMALASIEIPEGIELIGEATFTGCTSLRTVKISGKITEIEAEAFLGCESLSAIEIPKTVEIIGDNAFEGCSKLSKITFASGSGLLEIGDSAFLDCSSLSAVSFPSKLEVIGDSAFEGCAALSKLTFGSGLLEIGDSCFASCTSLTSVTLPSKLESLGSGAFDGCEKLKSATIPASVEYVGLGAFEGCSASLKLKVKKDSAGQEYAEDEEISYTIY